LPPLFVFYEAVPKTKAAVKRRTPKMQVLALDSVRPGG
jgi:hypothetical protein